MQKLKNLFTYYPMKKYYYFTTDLHSFNANSVLLKVSVGSSYKDAAKLTLVGEYCKMNAWYFEIVSDLSDKAVSNLAKRIFSGCFLPILRLKTAEVSISSLYRMIIENTLDSFMNGVTSHPNLFPFLMATDSRFYFLQSVGQRFKTASPVIRKNLKRALEHDSIRSLVNFGLILILFICASMLEQCEREIMMY